MRIGELAGLAGVSTRTVRHYHHLGLLPEPERRANGYREYRLRDAFVLARIRRLVELGLSLDEVRDVLADQGDRDLREILMGLDADLARQQEVLATRRARLAALLAEDELHPDSTVSPDIAEVLRGLSGGDDSRFARLDREMLTLAYAGTGPEDQERMTAMLRPLMEPEALARGHELYTRLDEIAHAERGDPRVAALARDMADHLPPEMTEAMVEHLPDGSHPEHGHWLEALADEMTPAQTEVFRLLVTILKEER
ncbi:MerR family transcriptional regulator [Actinomadura kijaniata]|uniref:MerR family transcriptional regulator n=1 Tax=Actinomadura kijaniata TaxID=46161 RepID=UPI00082A62DC|nr:MerR family transcriptional regulator [Actinomadura kijaniata]